MYQLEHCYRELKQHSQGDPVNQHQSRDRALWVPLLLQEAHEWVFPASTIFILQRATFRPKHSVLTCQSFICTGNLLPSGSIFHGERKSQAHQPDSSGSMNAVSIAIVRNSDRSATVLPEIADLWEEWQPKVCCPRLLLPLLKGLQGECCAGCSGKADKLRQPFLQPLGLPRGKVKAKTFTFEVTQQQRRRQGVWIESRSLQGPYALLSPFYPWGD